MHKRIQFQNCLLPWNVAISSYRTGMASSESVDEKRCASSKKNVRCGRMTFLVHRLIGGDFLLPSVSFRLFCGPIGGKSCIPDFV
jgi:hypothetical protein